MQSFLFTRRATRRCLLILFAFPCLPVFSQVQPEKLTVEKIMQDPKWIGTSPSAPFWSQDGKYLFFSWNPEKTPSDSLYYITHGDLHPRKATYDWRVSSLARSRAAYNAAGTAYVYSQEGDIFLVDTRTGKEKRITHTVDAETTPVFAFHDSKIVWSRSSNLFAWDLATGETEQLTNFVHTPPPPKEEKKEPANAQEKWLQQDQLRQFDVLRSRKEKRDLADSIEKQHPGAKPLRSIYIDDKMLSGVRISPDGRFVTGRLIRRPAGAKSTIVPSYVTESGFTQDIPGRTKVGAPQPSYSFFVFDTQKDTVIEIKTEQIPGIRDLPDYTKDYPSKTDTTHLSGGGAPTGSTPSGSLSTTGSTPSASNTSPTGTKRSPLRPVIFNGPSWSPDGEHAVVDIRSQDKKDRWLMLLDAATGKLKLLDRQRDEAWIGGPGISNSPEGIPAGWIDENTYWFQSEASGYSHLYKVNITTGEKTALTKGHYEILQASLSKDKTTFYITTNEVHPGEQQFYQLPVTGGKAERITTLTGANQVTISSDEKQLAILYSYTNKPWELYIQENKPGSHPQQVTTLAASDAFRAYPWRDPAVITFTARDGATVYARLYRAGATTTAGRSAGTTTAAGGPIGPSSTSANSTTASGRPAVIFVHGAGYLQNAHKWWSSYFREYMFNNLLADNGFTVLDIDYRGSAGYGRDWRTGIYRHMGGKDLSDQVDGVRYLVEHEGVDPKKVGIYGGSYGGFITLMAMFTEPDVFAAGAGLRCVTDWAHYNHGYTSDILNEPYNDSLAYRQSSPIYFAEGLKGHLLMCHGMVDENVHFQDIARLTQRLIELGKDNWELAVYPVEDHGFIEPSSWTDEYKRIFRLFQTWLK